jgi:hypothetical protein
MKTIFITLLAMVVASCASPSTNNATSTRIDSEVSSAVFSEENISGVYDSTITGSSRVMVKGSGRTRHSEVVILQDGNKVTATFADGGALERRREGNSIKFKWNSYLTHGEGKWMLNSDGSMTGMFSSENLGYAVHRGKWHLTRVKLN